MIVTTDVRCSARKSCDKVVATIGRSLSNRIGIMNRLMSAAAGIVALIAMPPPTAEAARICKAGHIYYAGSEFHANRLQAEASAVRAWRQVQAFSHGTSQAAHMFPEKDQLQCARATTNEGWRCF